VNFNAPHSSKTAKCSSGKEATLFKKSDKFHISSGKMDYLEYSEYKNVFKCPDEFPYVKYERDINRFCCDETMVTKQELFDFVNVEITKFVEKYSKTEINESDSLQILISKLLERRNIFVKWMTLAKEYNRSSIASVKKQLHEHIDSAESDIHKREIDLKNG